MEKPNERIGAYDHISVSNEKPGEEYTLLDIIFESFLRYVFVDGVFERTALA